MSTERDKRLDRLEQALALVALGPEYMRIELPECFDGPVAGIVRDVRARANVPVGTLSGNAGESRGGLSRSGGCVDCPMDGSCCIYEDAA